MNSFTQTEEPSHLADLRNTQTSDHRSGGGGGGYQSKPQPRTLKHRLRLTWNTLCCASLPNLQSGP